MKGKRGQAEGNIPGFLIGAVIVILFGIVIGYFIYTGYDWSKGALGTITPAELDVKYEIGCKNFYESNFKDSFCKNFNEVDVSGIAGKDAYITCQHYGLVDRLLDDNVLLDEDSVDADVAEFCGDSIENLAMRYCEELRADNKLKKKGAWINGFIFEEKDDKCVISERPARAGETPETPDDEDEDYDGGISAAQAGAQVGAAQAAAASTEEQAMQQAKLVCEENYFGEIKPKIEGCSPESEIDAVVDVSPLVASELEGEASAIFLASDQVCCLIALD